MHKTQSLRAQLLLRLIFPLLFIVILNGLISYYVTVYYVNTTYDYWLLDSARSLIQEIKSWEGKVAFDLPPVALRIFQWDDVDKTFFKIESRHTGLIAGDEAVPSPLESAPIWKQPVYFNSEIHGKEVRIVSMLVTPANTSEEVLVAVAETINKRCNMIRYIILAVVIPQILLVFIISFYLWIGIKRGLGPLHTLAQEIAQRSPQDLTLIPDSRVPLEVRILTHTINNLLQKLALAMTTQRWFIENAAHQLRTPLSGLKVQAERALRIHDLAAMQPALIQIKNCADQVSHLNTQLLVLARSEAVMESAQKFLPVDLCALSREICMDWVPSALEREIELSFDGPIDPVFVQGIQTLLRELLANILDNAIRYGREQGQIFVTLKAAPYSTLIVEDNGPGIPESELDKIFERFYRIPGSSGEGCGLGLAIVKEIADLHGAQVRVEQVNHSGGTRIEVSFS
jgi:two-component system sensor histidine kinase TctE